ncbi:MAG TPA: hypothetical protein VK541_11605 [Pedobacter sp.]|uniref:hypothetical protein n=1 Tax=Pedobacter sp. TaxID=1411316 RepID=UPI002C3A9E20|nr:hypothetical protein [Pedobacter sp.]HMI03122.1 hypothetical protein [Pedobacter sp.]
MKHQLIMPSSIDHLRNAIIDKLMAISSKDYLVALNKLMESAVEKDVVELSPEQILMLEMSDNDIKNENVIAQDDLDKEDLKWLKAL